jgi:hypothetical protein
MPAQQQELSAQRRGIAAAYAAMVVLLLLAIPVMGQLPGEVRTNPTPPPRPTEDPFKKIGESPWPEKPGMVVPGLPRSSVIEIKPSLAALKENVDLMATIDVELLGAIAAPSPDYATIVTDASDIRRLAVLLLRNLALPRKQTQAAQQDPGAVVSAEQLKASVNTLDSAIQSFLKSPVLTQPRTVDAKLLSDTGADLETIVDRSASVKERAARLASIGSVAKGGKAARTSASVRSRLKPKTSIQLSLECDVWSVSELLARPSEVKGHGSVNIGVEVQTRNHRLAQELVLPIEDCVDGEADEEATASNMQYVAIARDFMSYEVKGRIFAYQIGYEIGLTKAGQITKRLRLPIWFYYVDDAGDGTFELLRRSTRTGLVPDWAKELAGKH